MTITCALRPGMVIRPDDARTWTVRAVVPSYRRNGFGERLWAIAFDSSDGVSGVYYTPEQYGWRTA